MRKAVHPGARRLVIVAEPEQGGGQGPAELGPGRSKPGQGPQMRQRLFETPGLEQQGAEPFVRKQVVLPRQQRSPDLQFAFQPVARLRLGGKHFPALQVLWTGVRRVGGRGLAGRAVTDGGAFGRRQVVQRGVIALVDAGNPQHEAGRAGGEQVTGPGVVDDQAGLGGDHLLHGPPQPAVGVADPGLAAPRPQSHQIAAGRDQAGVGAQLDHREGVGRPRGVKHHGPVGPGAVAQDQGEGVLGGRIGDDRLEPRRGSMGLQLVFGHPDDQRIVDAEQGQHGVDETDETGLGVDAHHAGRTASRHHLLQGHEIAGIEVDRFPEPLRSLFLDALAERRLKTHADLGVPALFDGQGPDRLGHGDGTGKRGDVFDLQRRRGPEAPPEADLGHVGRAEALAFDLLVFEHVIADEHVLLGDRDVGGRPAVILVERSLAEQDDQRTGSRIDGAGEQIQVGQARAGLVESLVEAADGLIELGRHEQAVGLAHPAEPGRPPALGRRP